MRILHENVSNKILKNLKEGANDEWFKTEGLKIAQNIAGDSNQNCKTVSVQVVEAALNDGVDCTVVAPYVVNGEDRNNNHFCIKDGNELVDYTASQFLGDNKTVKYATAADNGFDVYVMDKSTMQGAVDDRIKNAQTAEEILKMANNGELDDYIIYML